jgi:hypothetical protein
MGRFSEGEKRKTGMRTVIEIETRPMGGKENDVSMALSNKLHLLALSKITKELSEMDTKEILLTVKISR